MEQMGAEAGVKMAIRRFPSLVSYFGNQTRCSRVQLAKMIDNAPSHLLICESDFGYRGFYEMSDMIPLFFVTWLPVALPWFSRTWPVMRDRRFALVMLEACHSTLRTLRHYRCFASGITVPISDTLLSHKETAHIVALS